jgi:phage tail P2-like protein
MMTSILPPNTTPLERAIEAAMHRRLGALPVPIRTLWNADTCPANLLGWLAWASSVDVWDDAWGEEQKRSVIRAAYFVHRHKGTVGAVRRALTALNIGLEIREWSETGDAPHTFRIDAFADYIFAGGLGINPALLDMISAHIDAIKPAHTHYSLRVGERFTTRQPLRAGTRAKYVNRMHVDADPRTFVETSTAFVRTAAHIRRIHNYNHDIQVRAA